MRLPVPEPCQIVRPWYAWRPRVHYDCPQCGDHLESPEREIGSTDHCPLCHAAFTVPGDIELHHWRQAREADAQTNHRAALLAIFGVIVGAIIIGVISSPDLRDIASDPLSPLDGGYAPFETPPASETWRVERSVSLIDDSNIVSIRREADSEVVFWPGRFATPAIQIHWEEGDLTVGFWLGGTTEAAGRHGFDTVTLRFDDREAVEWPVSQSSNRLGVIAMDPVTLIEEMLRSDRLVLRFTPAEVVHQTTTFDLKGLADVIVLIEAERGEAFGVGPR